MKRIYNDFKSGALICHWLLNHFETVYDHIFTVYDKAVCFQTNRPFVIDPLQEVWLTGNLSDHLNKQTNQAEEEGILVVKPYRHNSFKTRFCVFFIRFDIIK